MQENDVKEAAQEAAKKITISFEPVIEKLDRWLEHGIKFLPNFIVALIVLIIFYLLGRLIKRMMNKYIGKNVQNRAAVLVFSNIIFYIIIVLGLIISLSVLQLSDAVTGFLAGAGIVGVALGFAFQDTAANFISGTFMAFRKSFKVGDLVETNDVTAVVDEINLRSTKLKTLDGYEVTIPNKEIYQHKFSNFNRYPTRRIELKCGVGYESDLDQVQRVTLEVISSIEEIRKTPSPQFFYTEFGDSSINYVVRFWIDFLGMPDYLDARHLAIKAIRKAYTRENINIPFPIRTLDFGKNQLQIEQPEQKPKE